jgi:hypothetical protein
MPNAPAGSLTSPLYHGIFGEGFQSILSRTVSRRFSIEWLALTLFLFGLGIFCRHCGALSHDWRALRCAFLHGALPSNRNSTVHARLLVMFWPSSTACAGLSRYFTWLHFKHAAERDPGTRIFAERRQFLPGFEPPNLERRAGTAITCSRYLPAEEEGWRYSMTCLNEWDFSPWKFWWSIALQTVTDIMVVPKLTRPACDCLITTPSSSISLLSVYWFIDSSLLPISIFGSSFPIRSSLFFSGHEHVS